MTLFEIFRGRSPGQIQAKTSITEVLDLIPKMTHPIQFPQFREAFQKL